MIQNILRITLALLMGTLPFRLGWAGLEIEITQGVDRPTSIAVVPFEWLGAAPLLEDVGSIISADLSRSGEFIALDRRNMMSFPTRKNQVFYKDWRILDQEFLLIGKIIPLSDLGFSAHYELYDVFQQTLIVQGEIKIGKNQLRDAAHLISDKIYHRLTGIEGIFSTHIAYVTVNTHTNEKRRFYLKVADADGHREKTIRSASEPLLSPHWSPDGDKLSYVSFEGGRPGVYIQNIRTGGRSKVPSFRGMNSAPAWSPDGEKLAMVLSKDGNPEIYIFDISNQKFTRVTNHFGIDTEPNWAADGKSLVFTSGRGGQPQIYRKYLLTGKLERLTFTGDYNASGRLSKDGRYLVMVHKEEGRYNVAIQDLKRNRLKILTHAQLDESPSIAPNGSMLIYAASEGGKGVLAFVSFDGLVRSRGPTEIGDVREPAWSPR